MVTGLLLGNNLLAVLTFLNFIVLKLIFNPDGVIQITGIFNLSNIFYSFNTILWNWIKALGLGYIASIYMLKYNWVKDWPLVNSACNYLVR